MNRGIRFLVVAAVFSGMLLFGGPVPAAYADTLYVDGLCTDLDQDEICDDGITYKTIQEAIDDANSGDVIEVAEGTYVEQLEVISKTLTLVGAGPCTVVQSPLELNGCFAIENQSYYPVICLREADDITIRDLVVDGASNGEGNDRFVGIGYYDAGGTVDGVEIKDVRDTASPGLQYGEALYAYSEVGTTRSLTVTHCYIHDFKKSGIFLNGTNLTATVSHNTVVGSGPTDATVQNGIVVWGATGTVGPDNLVSNVSYTPGDRVASGILVYSDDADVLDNTVSNSQVGIYYWQGSGDISGNTVSASAAGVGTDSFWGVIVNDPPDAPASPFDDGFESWVLARGLGAMDTAAVSAKGNRLRCNGNSGSSRGLEAAAGYIGSDDLAFTATSNAIAGWDRGIMLNQCTVGCTGGTFTSASANQNSISSNASYGMYVEGLTWDVDATYNWWGHDSGPYHSSGNPGGQGDAVTDHVDWAPWLQHTYLPLAAHSFAPMPDLRVTSLVVEPDNPMVGQPVTITVEVENVGAVAAGPFWVDVYDNPATPPTEANQIWNYMCDDSVDDCYGIAWYVASGLSPGESVVLGIAQRVFSDYIKWEGYFVERGRHDLYVFADSWNGTIWYGAVLEWNEGLDNRYGPVTTCVQPGVGVGSLAARERFDPIPCRPTRP